MPIGPGKYDDLCTAARESANAEGCALIVINGAKGHGFSVQLEHLEDLIKLASALREIADAAEREYHEINS